MLGKQQKTRENTRKQLFSAENSTTGCEEMGKRVESDGKVTKRPLFLILREPATTLGCQKHEKTRENTRKPSKIALQGARK